MAGYFTDLIIRVQQVMNDNFKAGDIIRVKMLRKILKIGASNRSSIIMLSRVLAKFARDGLLEEYGRSGASLVYKVK